MADLVVPINVGDEGLSVAGVLKETSMEDEELEYLELPRAENVGVTGDGISELEELWV